MSHGNWEKVLFAGVVLFSAYFVSHRAIGNLIGAADFDREDDGTATTEALATVRTAGAPPLVSATLKSEGAVKNRIFYPTANTPPPQIEAQSAVIADLERGDVYFEVNAGKRWPLASLTKLMTAVVALQETEEEEIVTLLPVDFATESNADFLAADETYRAEDAIRMMLLASSNEIARALARSHEFSDFVRRMNMQAAKWGLEDTFFSEPAGLSPANQSTGNDLRKFVYHLYTAYPEVFRLTRQPKVGVTELRSGETKTVLSNNLFAGRIDFLGGKTGFTDDAGGNLISLFSHERRPLVIIVMGTADRFGDTEKLLQWFAHGFRASS